MLVVDEGYELADALQRVAKTLGLPSQQLSVSPEELRAAIDDHRALFRPQQHAELVARRRLTIEAMRSLAQFRPRLCGPLVHGDGPFDRIRLLLTADSAEQVIMTLSDLHIPWRSSEATMLFSARAGRHAPACAFALATPVSNWSCSVPTHAAIRRATR